MTLEDTAELITRSKRGDKDALEALFSRMLPVLRRWASGRLPPYARTGLDTEDLVMDTITQTLKHVQQFEPRHPGAFQAYLRQALQNRIRDEVRRVQRRVSGPQSEPESTSPPSPLEEVIGSEAVSRYENALNRLSPADRALIVARVELQQSYGDVAQAFGFASADAARSRVTRALARLASHMSSH